MSKKICIIPARGGSKRLPGKNIKPLNGKPLVFYTIDTILQSELFDKVIFTSDDENILNIVSNNYLTPTLQVLKRPTDLSNDTSKVIDTVMYYLDDTYEQTWLSLPTSPLKTTNDFIESVDMLTKEVDSVISYTEMEFPPSLGININNGYISDYDKSNPWITGNTRSQDHPIVYRPNGAIYGAWTSKLKDSKNYYTKNTKGYFMPRNRSVDIDTQFEFELAEFILKYNL